MELLALARLLADSESDTPVRTPRHRLQAGAGSTDLAHDAAGAVITGRTCVAADGPAALAGVPGPVLAVGAGEGCTAFPAVWTQKKPPQKNQKPRRAKRGEETEYMHRVGQ